MTWLPFALIAPIVATIINFIDKLVVETRIPSSRAVVVYLSLTNSVIGMLIWLVSGAVIILTDTAITLILSGMFFPIGVLLYFTALSHEETSKVIVLNQMTPIVVLGLSVALLGETITLLQLVGFLLILVSAIGISLTKQKGKLPGLSLVFWLLLGAAFSRALNVVLSAGVVNEFVVDFQTLLISIAYVNFGIGLGGLVAYLFLPAVRHAFNQHIRQPKAWQAFYYLIFSEGLVVVVRGLTFVAFVLGGPVALVSVIGGTQVFYAVIFGWILTLLIPQVYQETITRQDILRKLFWAGVLFVGLMLV